MSMFLNEEELVELTGKKMARSQINVLSRLGIRFIVNGMGKVIVSRSHTEKQLGGAPAKMIQEPNWEAAR